MREKEIGVKKKKPDGGNGRMLTKVGGSDEEGMGVGGELRSLSVVGSPSYRIFNTAWRVIPWGYLRRFWLPLESVGRGAGSQRDRAKSGPQRRQ